MSDGKIKAEIWKGAPEIREVWSRYYKYYVDKELRVEPYLHNYNVSTPIEQPEVRRAKVHKFCFYDKERDYMFHDYIAVENESTVLFKVLENLDLTFAKFEQENSELSADLQGIKIRLDEKEKQLKRLEQKWYVRFFRWLKM